MNLQPAKPVQLDRDRLLALRSSVDSAVNSLLQTSYGNTIEADGPANLSNALVTNFEMFVLFVK